MVKRKVDEHGLTSRERRFADEYIANGQNAKQAYKVISPNAKDSTCEVNGHKTLRSTKVSEYIKLKTIERLNASNLRAEDVLDRLIEIGFGKVHKGYSKQTDNITGDVLKDVNYEYVFDNDNQVKALELLGKNMAMWTDKVDIEGGLGVTIVDDIDDD